MSIVLDARTSRRLTSAIVTCLYNGAFAKPSRWSAAVVIIRPEGHRVTSRGDFAQWLLANGLPDQARECIRRRIRPNEILCWIESEEFGGTTGFFTFDLRRGIAAEPEIDSQPT